MASETTEKVMRLLQPTHDTEGWLDEIAALDATEAIPVLSGVMQDQSQPRRMRAQAISLLGFLRDERAVGALMQALSSPEPLVRAQAARSLGQIGKPLELILPALLGSLDDADYFVRECAAKSLALLRHAEAIPALERMRDADSVSTNREVAAKSLQFIHGNE